MNYPQKQFEQLKELVSFTKKHDQFTIDIHPCALHYFFYEQFSEGHKHNWLYTINGNIKRGHSIDQKQIDSGEAKKIFNMNFNEFELYPDRCNDNHIETAVKKAIKETN
jgi:hypothetical protein